MSANSNIVTVHSSLDDLEDGEIKPESEKITFISPVSVSDALEVEVLCSESTQRDDNGDGPRDDVNVELFVGDLSFFCTESDLVELFSPFGAVLDTRIRRSDNRGHSLMYGFVKMETLAQAESAATALNDMLHKGRTLRVQVCTLDGASMTKPPRPGTHVHVTFVSDNDNANLINEERLRRLFERFGDISDVIVKRHTMTENPQRQNGYGFVYFFSRSAAEDAVKEFHDQTIENIKFECELSHRSITGEQSATPGQATNTPNAKNTPTSANTARSAMRANLSLRSFSENTSGRRNSGSGFTSFGEQRDNLVSPRVPPPPVQSPNYRLPPSYPTHTHTGMFASPPQQNAQHVMMMPIQQQMSPHTTHAHPTTTNVYWTGAPPQAHTVSSPIMGNSSLPGSYNIYPSNPPPMSSQSWAPMGMYNATTLSPPAPGRSPLQHFGNSPEMSSAAFPSGGGIPLPSYGAPAFFSVFPGTPASASASPKMGVPSSPVLTKYDLMNHQTPGASPHQHNNAAPMFSPYMQQDMSMQGMAAGHHRPQFFADNRGGFSGGSDPFCPPFYQYHHSSPRPSENSHPSGSANYGTQGGQFGNT